MKIDRAVCINLDRRVDRWAQCLEEFKKLSFQVERFSALNGGDLKQNIDNANIGLRLSVAQILENARRDKLSNVLILEDDVEFIHVGKLHDPPPDFDLYYWGFIHHGVSRIKVMNEKWLQLIADCHATHAILYPAKVFEEIMLGLRGTTKTIDGYMADTFQRRLRVYCNNPPVAVQRDSPSDLSAESYRHLMRSVTLIQYNDHAVPQGALPIVE